MNNETRPTIGDLLSSFLPPHWRGLSSADQERKLLYALEGDGLFKKFLEHSTQKEHTAAELAQAILTAMPVDIKQSGRELNWFDIGSGEGTMLAKIIKHLQIVNLPNPTHFRLLEPNPFYIKDLQRIALVATEWLRPPLYAAHRINTIKSDWESYQPTAVELGSYDILTCSHTIYHFNQQNFKELFTKMWSLMRPDDGRMYIVARHEDDDAYKFIHKYFTETNRRPFNEITIEDAMPALSQIAGQQGLGLQMIDSEADVTLPFASNPQAAHDITGFFLRRPWDQIPQNVKVSIESTFNHQDVKLKQVDGIVVIGRGVENINFGANSFIG